MYDEAFAAVTELQKIHNKVANKTVEQQELAKCSALLQDLLFYRFYGFKHPYVELLLSTNEQVRNIYESVAEEERTYCELERIQKGSRDEEAVNDSDGVVTETRPIADDNEQYRKRGSVPNEPRF